jgi:hypothetical protein
LKLIHHRHFGGGQAPGPVYSPVESRQKEGPTDRLHFGRGCPMSSLRHQRAGCDARRRGGRLPPGDDPCDLSELRQPHLANGPEKGGKNGRGRKR